MTMPITTIARIRRVRLFMVGLEQAVARLLADYKYPAA
jgi:hypothetical protein